MLDALRIAKVDFYGDSYGTYVGQAFAVRHADRLRSLVLDGAYPLPGTDPAFGDLAEATWRAPALACERQAPACGEDPVAVARRGCATGSAPTRSPAAGSTPTASRIRVRLDEDVAGDALIQSGYGNLPMYRDLRRRAIRAFEAGDRAPLLRLVAENTLDPTASPVRSFSEALYLAVTCHDYPQLWDPAAPFAVRREQLARRAPAQPPARFAPIHRDRSGRRSTTRARRRACAGPARAAADPPVPPGAPYPAVPTLVHQRRPRQHHRVVGRARRRLALPALDVRGDRATRSTSRRSATATTARRRSCAASSARSTPATRAAPTRIAEVRAVDALPAHRGGAEPAAARRATAAASGAARRRRGARRSPTRSSAGSLNYSGASRGLRGGRWSYTRRPASSASASARARFVRDVPVSGTATWRLADGAVRARLRLPGRGRLRARWNAAARGARATLAGALGGRRVSAVMRAP